MRRWMAAGVVGVTSLACGGAFEETQHALDAGDHAVLVEIADLKGEFPSLVVDPTAEEWSKVKSMGTWELEYQYETDDFVLSSFVFLEESPDDASWVFWGLGLAPAMMENEGIEFVVDDGLLTLGDERSCGLLRSEGAVAGNLCSVRDGSVVMAIVLVGGYFDQPGDLDRILASALSAAKTHAPKESPLP
ncbi:MAG: hypothetical protein H6737_19705 [Alphaproteobacteria bacterium]|nr:hypothetical protein [Alphaproteobacteria bacterium]